MEIDWKVEIKALEYKNESPYAVELAVLEAVRQIAEQLAGIREELAGLGVQEEVKREVASITGGRPVGTTEPDAG